MLLSFLFLLELTAWKWSLLSNVLRVGVILWRKGQYVI